MTTTRTGSREAATLIQRLSRLSGRVAVADLLKQFVDATGYRAILLEAGDARAALNVSKLLQDAQGSGIVGVGEFLEYVQGLRAAGSREGEARADSTGSVQIMSVHQAKGLEFPIVVIGDAGSTGGGGSDCLLDDRLGVIPNLVVDGRVPVVRAMAEARAERKESAETLRLLYVATTRASERLLINGHVGVSKSGELKSSGWLHDICGAIGLERTPDGFDMNGNRALPIEVAIGDGVALGAVVLEPEYSAADSALHLGGATHLEGDAGEGRGDVQRTPEVRRTDDFPRLLAPVGVARGEEQEQPDRVWRVAPRATQRWAPSWVIGKLVHEAIAAWRFPDDPAFAAWCQARARACGLADGAQLDDALRRTRRLLANLRRHPLYAEDLRGKPALS